MIEIKTTVTETEKGKYRAGYLGFSFPEVAKQLAELLESYVQRELRNLLAEDRAAVVETVLQERLGQNSSSGELSYRDATKLRTTVEAMSAEELATRFRRIANGAAGRHEASCTVSFQRTLRLPDDGGTYPLPPGLGLFPLKRVDDFGEAVPEPWRQRGGVMLPMYQAEALWLDFDTATNYPVALKVGTGKINAISGQPWSPGLPIHPQGYVVLPEQPWLDGYCVALGQVRQFVAVKLGDSYTVEEQLTGEAEFGGIQLEAIPLKAEAYFDAEVLTSLPKDLAEVVRQLLSEIESENRPRLQLSAAPPAALHSAPAAPESMGLAAGGRMKQEIYEDTWGHDDWDLSQSSRCFVQLCHAEQWQQVTGEAPPQRPPTAADYSKHGLPWFDYYQDKLLPVSGSGGLDKLKPVSALAKKKGDASVPLDDSAAIKKVTSLGPKTPAKPVAQWDDKTSTFDEDAPSEEDPKALQEFHDLEVPQHIAPDEVAQKPFPHGPHGSMQSRIQEIDAILRSAGEDESLLTTEIVSAIIERSVLAVDLKLGEAASCTASEIALRALRMQNLDALIRNAGEDESLWTSEIANAIIERSDIAAELRFAQIVGQLGAATITPDKGAVAHARIKELDFALRSAGEDESLLTTEIVNAIIEYCDLAADLRLTQIADVPSAEASTAQGRASDKRSLKEGLVAIKSSATTEPSLPPEPSAHGSANRTIVAVVVCLLIFMAYVLIGAALGWKHGGGMIPMLILLMSLRAAWKGIAGGVDHVTSRQSASVGAPAGSPPSSPAALPTSEPHLVQQELEKAGAAAQSRPINLWAWAALLLAFAAFVPSVSFWWWGALGLAALGCAAQGEQRSKRLAGSGRLMAFSAFGIGMLALVFQCIILLDKTTNSRPSSPTPAAVNAAPSPPSLQNSASPQKSQSPPVLPNNDANRKVTAKSMAYLDELKSAANNGDADAQWQLGKTYQIGYQVPQDDPTAVAWYRKAAAKGHAGAQASLADCLWNGIGVAQDQAAAIRLYRDAANQGQEFAQAQLADCLIDGPAPMRAIAEGIEWHRKAAFQGVYLSKWRLGQLHEVGKQTPKDMVEALMWYRLAEDQANYEEAAYQESMSVYKKQKANFDQLKAKYERDKLAAEEIRRQGYIAPIVLAPLELYPPPLGKPLRLADYFSKLAAQATPGQVEQACKRALELQSRYPQCLGSPTKPQTSTPSSTGPSTPVTAQKFDPELRHLAADVRLDTGSVLVDRLQAHGGKGTLTLDNGLTEDAFVKLIRGGTLVASFYVQGGTKFTFDHVPDGAYDLLYCSGFGWDRARRDFERGRHARRYDSPLTYSTRKQQEGNSIVTYTDQLSLTLHKVAYGNATTKDISLEEFDRY